MLKKMLFVAIACFCNYAFGQTVIVGGACIGGSYTLASAGMVNGKPAYTGKGTVAGFANVDINLYWLGPPDNLWVLDFDGQPFFSNPLNTAIPPSTNTSTPWVEVVAGACTGAMPLSITGSGVLPVKLIAFNALLQENTVHLKWQTANDFNNKGFVVERSTDLQSWTSLEFIAAKPSTDGSSYSYLDLHPVPGENFYRLRQTDLNGTVSYSAINRVFVSLGRPYVLGRANAEGNYRFTPDATNTPLRIRLIDLQGRVLMSAGVNGNTIIDLQGRAKGVYVLDILVGRQHYTEKLLR